MYLTMWVVTCIWWHEYILFFMYQIWKLVSEWIDCYFLLFKVFDLPAAILYLPTQWTLFTTCHCRNDCCIYEEACWGGGTCNSLQCTQDFWSLSVTWISVRLWYYRGSPIIHSSSMASSVNCQPGCALEFIWLLSCLLQGCTCTGIKFPVNGEVISICLHVSCLNYLMALKKFGMGHVH